MLYPTELKEHLYSLYSHTDCYCQTFIKQESIAL
nr:MAG TPA: hypothetical protein [Crassvirales sp.]